MRETRWDCIDWTPPDRSFDTRPALPDAKERLDRTSSNCYVTTSGSVSKRWGTGQSSGLLSGKKITKIWVYETLPAPALGVTSPYSYLLLSVRDTTTGLYSLYSKDYTTGPTVTPSAVTALRSSNSSTKPHKITFSKGLAYVKFFPDASTSEKYATILLDGTSGSIAVRPWGLPGPAESATAAVRCARISGETIRLTAAVTASATTFNTTTNTPMPATPYDLWIGYEKVTVTAEPTSTSLTVTRGAGGTTAEAHDANEVLIYRDWDASDHKVDVQYGWKYAFAYVSVTGQVSNRSDVEYNPDLMPSNTGPFYDLIPKIDLTLDSWFYSDTTTYPYLNMYRTTDGGGTFYFLEQVANPGTSTYTYEDDSFGTGASSTTYNDPVPDLKLDTARYAPSLTSNSIPPTVNPPGIVGTTVPSQSCYALATFASRIWMGIDHYLHFSSREETRDGIGEECFPSGNLGNFFILDAGIVGMAANANALYVITTNDIWKVTGSTLDTFAINKIISGVGGYTAESCAISYSENIAFLAKEGECALIRNDQIEIISKPLTGVLPTEAFDTVNFNINYYRDREYEWLIFSDDTGTAADGSTTFSRWFIYDIIRSRETNTNFWHAPWYTISTATAALRSTRSSTTGLFGAIYRASPDTSCLVEYNTSTTLRADTAIPVSATGVVSNTVASVVSFGTIRCPSGNHLNALSTPVKDVNYYGTVALFRTTAGGSIFTTPTFSTYYDNYPSLAATVSATEPPRIRYDNSSTANDSYNYYFYPSNIECQRLYPSFSETSLYNWELLGISFIFDPKPNP